MIIKVLSAVFMICASVLASTTTFATAITYTCPSYHYVVVSSCSPYRGADNTLRCKFDMYTTIGYTYRGMFNTGVSDVAGVPAFQLPVVKFIEFTKMTVNYDAAKGHWVMSCYYKYNCNKCEPTTASVPATLGTNASIGRDCVKISTHSVKCQRDEK